MINNLLRLFTEYHEFALLISLCLSVLVAVLGIVPSVFITAANILFFGFWNGMFISFLGEAIGAGIAFLLYRRGFKKRVEKKLGQYPKVQRLVNAKGKEAFYLVLNLRLIPFVPSGLITFAAAVGQLSFGVFMIASSLGKFPALLIEAYSVYEVSQFGWVGKLILGITAMAVLFWVINRINKK